MRFFLAFIISTLLLSSAVEGMKFFDELEEQFCKTTNGENPNDSMCVISGAISKSACLEACEGGVSGHNCDFQDDDVTACEWVEGWGCKLYIEPMEPVGTPYPDHSCWVRKHAVTLMHQGTQCDDRSDALGTGLSPEQCAAVVHEAGCETGVFMYSGYSYHYTWGCRCCHSTDGLTGNGNWDVYQIGEKCADGWIESDSACFWYSGTQKIARDFIGADAYCNSLNDKAHVATIQSETQSNACADLVGSWANVHIGLYYEQEMKWISEEPVNYIHNQVWGSTDSHGECTRIVGSSHHWCPGCWDDWSCDTNAYFLCSYSLTKYGGRRLHSVGASVASFGNNRLLLENSKL